MTRNLRCHHEPLLAWCDPVTGDLIRARRITGHPYGREHPGEPIHIDVMRLGWIPDGGGWRALGHQTTGAHKQRKVRTGFDCIHAVIDDHPRLAYVDVLPDEKGAKAAAFLVRAADFYRQNGIPHIERVISEMPSPTGVWPRSSRTAPTPATPNAPKPLTPG